MSFFTQSRVCTWLSALDRTIRNVGFKTTNQASAEGGRKTSGTLGDDTQIFLPLDFTATGRLLGPLCSGCLGPGVMDV